tara:strand:+ start:105 stop:359 length:255 start_codon:yes stop_codon:yes gene_type:complete
MLSHFNKYHENINDYSKYTNIKCKEDFEKVFYDDLVKYKITAEQYSVINLYLKMSYLYFANYSENKIQKQKNQVMANMKTIAVS